MDLYKAIRTIALREVMKETGEYQVRNVQRWFSKTFHTPLLQVEELPLEYVLQHFYESRYEDLDEADRDKERISLIESPEEAAKRVAEENYEQFSMLEFEKFAEEQVVKERKKLELDPKLQAREAKPVTPKIRELREASLDDGVSLVAEPGISMNFLSAAEMEEQLESGGIAGGEDEEEPPSNLDLRPRPAPKSLG
jgi:hypothetical protein